jgi:hypothetical protein
MLWAKFPDPANLGAGAALRVLGETAYLLRLANIKV